MTSQTFVIVAAYNEADRIADTLAALADAFPGAPVWVADDGSSDATAAIARAAGARVVHSERRAPRWSGMRGKGGAPGKGSVVGKGGAAGRGSVVGKGGAVTLAARAALASSDTDASSVALLCDGDLAQSAARLGALVDAVRAGDADLAVAVFARRVGGGLGLAVGFARWAIRRRCGLALNAPISGQRSMRAGTLARLLPFAHGFGMEIGMTVDAARAGYRVVEVELDLSHRATGRTVGGFAHRGRQLIDFVRVYVARR